MTGTQDEVLSSVTNHSKLESYRDPTEILPHPPPPLCSADHTQNESCDKCEQLIKWWKQFETGVDDLATRNMSHARTTSLENAKQDSLVQSLNAQKLIQRLEH
ncbi:hypothetical protein AX14_009220 [Amanita brunnescens Koide BX004]|nr:hypothetical protein AX14_009220 [Amanita brunnescens Koide BX004]